MNALTSRRHTKINRLVHEIPCLPQETIEEILIRLPIKSLGRFKCVSKSWNSLIASRCFIKAHLEKSSTNASLTNRKVITNLHTIREWSLPSLLGEPLARHVEYVFPTHDEYCPFDIVGCCDGLLCILEDERDFIIWNPSTKKFNRLPSIVDRDLELDASGFGYDESTDDYKVFGFLHGDKKGVAKVYSLKTGSWRIVDVTIKIDPFIGYFGNFFSGKLHWSRCVAEEPKVQWEICTFDLQNENFGLVELPDNLDYGSYRPSFVGALDGSLCMVCKHGRSQFDVWIKKQESSSWHKMVALLHPLAYDVYFMDPLFVGPNGEILFADGFSFAVYHPKDAQFSYPQLIDKEQFLGVHVYVESLVSAVPHVQTPPTAGELAKSQLVAERSP